MYNTVVYMICISDGNQRSKAVIKNHAKKRKTGRTVYQENADTTVMEAENVMNVTFYCEIKKKQRFSLNLRKLQDILVCYMCSSPHHGAKDGLLTETF